jgi:hypothetical protein
MLEGAKLLVGQPMTDRSKCRGQTKFSSRFSMLCVGCEAKKHTLDKITVKTPWRAVAPVRGSIATISVDHEVEIYIGIEYMLNVFYFLKQVEATY